MSDLFVNKVAAAGLTTLLGLMGLNMMGSSFFSREKPEQPGFLVEVASTDSGHSDEPEWIPPTDYGTLLVTADAGKGETKAKACISCHTFEDGGATKQGPNLYNIVMRDKGTVAGFGYSDALTSFGGQWDYEALDKFLQSPKKYISGTAMNYAGLSKETDRMNVIAYLRTLSTTPPQLPAPLPPEALLPPAADLHGEEHADASHGDDHAAVVEAAVTTEVEAVASDAADTVEGVVDAVATEAADTAADAQDMAEGAIEGVIADVTDAAEEAADDVEDAVEHAEDAAHGEDGH